MKYFFIDFPNHTKFIVKTPEGATARGLASLLNSSKAFVGHGDVVYNPKQFISVYSISSINDQHKRLAKNLEEVLF